jgi:integrase
LTVLTADCLQPAYIVLTAIEGCATMLDALLDIDVAADAEPKHTTKKRAPISITKRVLDALEPTDQDLVLWDKKLKGFGIRQGRDGRVAFIIQYRNPQGRSKRITIGTYGAYTAETARTEAERLLGQARAARHGWDDAKDPAEGRQEERTAIGFSQLVDEYMDKVEKGLVLTRKGKAKQAGTVATDRYRVAHLKRFFGDRAVKGIDRADCRKCLEMLIAGKHGATRTYGLLGAIFGYAIDENHTTTNPTRGVTTPADGARVFRLDAAGYRVLGEKLEAAEARAEDWRAIGAIRLIALTGARRGEITGLKISEIDWAERCIRKATTKAGEGETVQQNVRPMSQAALAVLTQLVNRPGRRNSAWVFPGRALGKVRPYDGLGDSRNGAWGRIVGNAYTPHSLRHAFSTAAAEIGLSELTISHLVGHAGAKKGSTTRRYIHVDKVLLDAADQIGAHIWSAMTTDESGGA